MQPATPLHPTTVRRVGDHLVADGLVVADECAVRLASEADDPAKLLQDAIEIGARILDREHVGAQSEVVKAEFEAMKASFTDRAKAVADRLDQKVDQAFGDEDSAIARVMARHFGDDSSHAVQHKLRTAFTDVAKEMREDLRRQLFAEGDDNPLAKFHRIQLAVAERAEKRHSEDLRAVREQMEATRLEIERLRSEKEKLEQLAAERERGTAKGRTYEEAVAEELDRLAAARGDDCEAVGDHRGEGGRKGDVVVGIDGSSGPARGRIVFEVKNSKLSRKEAMAELDGALTTRGADYAILVVPSEERMPARTNPLREYNGDKLFVTYNPDDESSIALEVAYGLARARVLMARSDATGLDPSAVRAEVERAAGAMEDVRRVKSQLTNARTGIDNAEKILEAMVKVVRGHLAEVEALVAAAEAGEDDDAPAAQAPPAPATPAARHSAGTDGDAKRTPTLADELRGAAPAVQQQEALL